MEFTRKLCRLLAYPFLWPVIHMPGRSYAGPMTELGLVEETVAHDVERIVRKLADEFGERNAKNYKGFLDSVQFISEEFQQMGYPIRKQSFWFDNVEMFNIEAEKRGTVHPELVVVVGAHYDTVYGSPGADDNASGVGAMLAIARLLRDVSLPFTVRFVAFANEENPSAVWETMGSYAYARECRERGDQIVAMLSLEMLGVYSDVPGSQRYPYPFNLLYPNVGNFVGFIGNLASGALIRKCIGSFRRHCQFPSEGVAAPEMFRDTHRSDHWSFWQFGYRALMVTDTSNFRYALYHTDKDTPSQLDFRRLGRVTVGLAQVVKDLASAR